MGEVDQLQDAVDERVAERDQGVDRPRRDADQEDGEEVARRADEVDDEPRGQQRNEEQAEQRDTARPPVAEESRDRGLLLGAG
jgi:hypothetical protein